MNGESLVPAFRRLREIFVPHVPPLVVTVDARPALQNAISPMLRKRMQGKSCFNFVAVDEPLFAELAGLTARSAADFRMNDVALDRRPAQKKPAAR